MVAFDAYTATSRALPHGEVLSAFPRFAGDRFEAGRGFHTFKERVSITDQRGDSVGMIQWGGRQADLVMVEVKGYRTAEAVEWMRAEWPHRCTRVDSAVDVERPGAFDELLGKVLKVKADHRLYGEKRGDWEFPEKGRTQYLGADSSAVRARLYEKGKQPDLAYAARADWVRLELQVRPQKDAKEHFASLNALEVWGACKWSRQLAALVLLEQIEPCAAGTVRKETTRDRALRWMVGQYGAHLVSLADDLGGWEVLGLTLREMVAEERGSR